MTPQLVGLIGGTGLGQAFLKELSGQLVDVDTPFGRPSAPILRGRWNGAEVALLPRHGLGHVLPPTAVPYRANIYALKKLGVTHILASGATGSLREEIRPRDLVIVDQVIDRTTHRASTFFDEPGAAVHVEFSEPFCPVLRQVLLDSAEAFDGTIHDGGTYVCMEGPAFSSVAESRMNRALGGDLIGMTCMPEAKLAREAEMCYALVGLPTDYDCWRPHDTSVDRRTLLREIMHNMEMATARSVDLIQKAVARIAADPPGACACRTALDLAIWTPKAAIDAQVRQRLDVIWGRCFLR